MKKLTKKFLLFLLVLAAEQAGHADERYAPASYWLSRGYDPVISSRSSDSDTPNWPAHSIPWPVVFQSQQFSLGNSMAEFQDYGDGPYYHGGCDLRVSREQKVFAPISGRIAAGHYGYSNNSDGSSVKYWKPWPESGDANYFEVAVISDDGYRFEFHHVNVSTLPHEVVALLEAGGGRVQKGQLLGQAVVWPVGGYHHIHANIYTPSGVQLNPEYYYESIQDHLPPNVEKVFAVMKNRKVLEFGNGQFSDRPDFFALVSQDKQDGNVYVHPPVVARIQFDSGEKFSWDFSERLSDSNGGFPDIWKFFLRQIIGPSGESYETSGGYGTGISVIQVPVPRMAQGGFVLELGDVAGNFTRFKGQVATH